MPILPLDQPEPFAATLGVTLYPGSDEADSTKARALCGANFGPIATDDGSPFD